MPGNPEKEPGQELLKPQPQGRRHGAIQQSDRSRRPAEQDGLGQGTVQWHVEAGRFLAHETSAPPPKEKKERKKLEAAKAMERPKTIWINRRNPPEVSPKAKVRPVTMMIMTAMILATGPCTESRICCRGCSQGMLEPAAWAEPAHASDRTVAEIERPMTRMDDVTGIGTSFVRYSDGMGKIGKLVMAVGTKPGYLGDGFDASVRTAALDKDDHIDGLCDEASWHAGDSFLDELLQSIECSQRRIGMQGGDAAGMASVPGFQHVERFDAADLAHDDPVWSQPQRRTDEIRKSDDAGPRS